MPPSINSAMPPAMPPTRDPAPRGPAPPRRAPARVGLLGGSPCLLACLLACLLCCHSPPPAAAVDWSQYPDTLVPPDYDPDAPPPEDHSRAAQERRLEQQRVAPVG